MLFDLISIHLFLNHIRIVFIWLENYKFYNVYNNGKAARIFIYHLPSIRFCKLSIPSKIRKKNLNQLLLNTHSGNNKCKNIIFEAIYTITILKA